MVDKELIENWRNMVKLPISSLLFKTNYEGMGEQDKEEFERDFDEILDLALIGLKHKAQLSQKDATKDATTDTISRQAAITALSHMCSEDEKGITVSRANVDSMLKSLLPAQPEEAIPVSWIEARIKRFMTMDNAFGGLTANIMLVMLNEWKREQEDDNETGRIHGSGI